MVIKKEEFSLWVEKTRAKTKEDYMDTVLAGCEKFDIDLEFVSALLSPQLIQKIKSEAIDKRYFKTDSASLKAFLGN